MWRRAGLAALVFTSSAPSAVASDIVSTAPDAVAVTIYRDGPARTADLANLDASDVRGLALVVETRTVDLPAGRSRVRFEGVADGIVAESAAVEGLPSRLLERNFDYDLLSPGSLIARSIGQRVRVITTDAKTGREHQEAAAIASGPDGVSLDFGDRVEALHCGGEIRRLVFDRAPAGLTDRPTLSVLVDAPSPRRVTVRVSYLTARLDWSADYIARINPDGRTLNLTGWITLANRGATGFVDAPTAVVAGNLARVPVTPARTVGPSEATHCWPDQTTHGGWVEPAASAINDGMALNLAAAPRMLMARRASAVAPSATPAVTQGELGDYKLYTLPEPTTVAAHQTKQILFLAQPAVKFVTVYVHDVNVTGAASLPALPARVVLRLENMTDQGLGRPLPAGNVGIRRQFEGRERFVGEYPLSRDVPVGEPFEIAAGAAFDITVSQRATADTGRRQSYEVVADNAKATPITLEIRLPRDGASGFRVVDETIPHGERAGSPVWRIALPAGGERTLRYTVERRSL